MSARFERRRIVVTGGASGIGAAVARMAHGEGASVAILDLDAARAQWLADGLGPRATAHACDATDEAAVRWALDAVAEGGVPDGLVCCAGAPDSRGPAEDIDIDAWQRVLDSHVRSTMVACRIVGAMMLSAGGGAIVNVGSVLSFNPGPVLAYGAGKAAIASLTASLGTQWAARGVRVNAAAPGWTDTPFLRPGGVARDFGPILAATPVRRLLAPEEIAEVICFLLSPASSAIVGTTVSCDGGVRAAAGFWPYGGLPAEEAAHG